MTHPRFYDFAGRVASTKRLRYMGEYSAIGWRRSHAHHVITTMCGLLSFMAAVTLWVQDRDEHGKVVQHYKTEGRAFAAWLKAAYQW
jgi:hypothetical protein